MGRGKIGKFGFLPLLTLFVLVLTGVGCSTIRVRLDYDRHVDFSRYKTYAWGPEKRPNLSEARNDLIDARIKEDVSQLLASKGYVLVPESEADFLLSYQSKIEDKTRTETFYDYYPYGSTSWHHHGMRHHHHHHFTPYYMTPRTYVYSYKEWTLTLNMMDRVSGQLIWRGTAIRDFDGRPLEALDRKVSEVISRLLKKYPPSPFAQPALQSVQKSSTSAL